MPDNPRIGASPVPAVLHIVGGVLFLLVGAFQFSGRVRRRWPTWHRRAGRGLVVLGLVAAVAALWMTLSQHRAWMMRAYALAMGAGTQAFTIGIGEGIFGKTVLTTDLSTAAGWFINLAVAELIIRRPARRRPQTRPINRASAAAVSG